MSLLKKGEIKVVGYFKIMQQCIFKNNKNLTYNVAF